MLPIVAPLLVKARISSPAWKLPVIATVAETSVVALPSVTVKPESIVTGADATLSPATNDADPASVVITGCERMEVLDQAIRVAGSFIPLTQEQRQELLARTREAAASGKFAFPPIIDTKVDQPEVELMMDRDKVAALGLNMATVGADLGALVGGNFVNRFSLDGRSYKVIPQLKRVERLNPDQLGSIYVKGPNGSLVPLSTFATLKKSTQPRSLNKFQQFNAVKISGQPTGSVDDALRYLETEAAKILPKGYKLDYTGESRQLRVEGDKFLPAFVLSVVLIILVLAAQFNSFRDPFIIILGSVPLAMFGALIFSFLKLPVQGIPFWTNGWTTTLNIYAQVGLVTLVGLVSKNGILIVEFANALQRRGLTKIQAAREAALVRLRPVLMTSAATVCGHFPLTLVTGAGAAARNSIGITVVAGMALGTIFTLLVIPSIYVLIAKQHAGEELGAIGRGFELAPQAAPVPTQEAEFFAK